MFPVKGDYGIEILALFAFEAFEQFGLSFCEQFLDFVIGQGASRFQRNTGSPHSVLSQRTTLP